MCLCSSLGKPRRFSERFLHVERMKLEHYRESVRQHYTELCAGIREGLPTDLARPLSVGQRVIALHPKTREVHDGSVLTVYNDKCRILFDDQMVGVKLVMVGLLSSSWIKSDLILILFLWLESCSIRIDHLFCADEKDRRSLKAI